jgi:hypothetical protein
MGSSTALPARRPLHVVLILLLCAPVFMSAGERPLAAQPWTARTGIATSRQLSIGGATIQVDFANGPLDLPIDAVYQHIQAAAQAVTAYYGRFPVARARVLVIPVADRRGGIQGTTWGNMDGYQGFTRLRIGQHTTAADLAQDWVTTHELTHMAVPSVPDDNHWIEEGLATYVEPLARVMTGDLTPGFVWQETVQGMPHGEPQPGDQGLDRTHTWGRTYWGGALFCLVADVEIRRQTHNRKGLRDALRAIVDHGGTIDQNWPLEKALKIGDRATGTHVLTQMYAKWKDAPVHVDLAQLWSELGIRQTPGGGIEFVSTAPLAVIRESIAGAATAPQQPNPALKP